MDQFKSDIIKDWESTEIVFESIHEFEYPEHEFSIFFSETQDQWYAEKWDEDEEEEDQVIFDPSDYSIFPLPLFDSFLLSKEEFENIIERLQVNRDTNKIGKE